MRKNPLVFLLLMVHAAQPSGAATVERLLDVNVQEIAADSHPRWLGALGDRAFFAARTYNDTHSRLYRSDGSSDSTVLVSPPSALANPRDAVQINGRLVFLASNDNQSSNQLWSIPGESAAPLVVRTFTTRIDDSLHWLGVAGTRGYFVYGHMGSADYDMYVTDGTSGGTVRVAAGRRVSLTPTLATDDGGLYFLTSATTNTALAIWRSDGTVTGTQEVIPLSATTLTGFDKFLHVENGIALVSGTDTLGGGVFSLDLASGATTRLADPTSAGVTDIGLHAFGVHLFIRNHNLWRSDGTPAGTYALTDSDSINGVSSLTRVAGRVIFVNSEAAGAEAWSTDGTLAGTQIIRDITPGPSGTTYILGATPTHAFLLSGGGMSPADPARPTQFWITDGTSAGTRLIPQRGGAAYNLDLHMRPLAAGIGSQHAWLMVHDYENLPGGNNASYYQVWATDLSGTDAVRVGSSGQNLLTAGDRLFFDGILDERGVEPWVSDGSVAGTQRLGDISVSGINGGSDPRDFTVFGDQVVFTADDGLHGRELWISDGTAAGTRMVRDILGGPPSGAGGGLLVAGDLLYFIGVITADVSDGPGRLWRSDGTEAGTFQLGDTRASAGGGIGGGCASWAVAYNGRVWFFASTIPSSGHEMWSTDGTAAGTRMEFELPAELRFASLCELHATSNGFVFLVDGPAGALWRSDGTPAGTQRLGTMRPAGSVSYPRGGITVVNGVGYFMAEDAGGFEPWRTNGTEAGTARIADVISGSAGAQHFRAVPFGNGVMFTYSSESGNADGVYRVADAGAAPVRVRAGDVRDANGLPISTGSHVYFALAQGDTESLWASDGTSAGTREVFNPGAGSSLTIGKYAGGDGVLFFHAPEGQLWSTSGAGTARKLSSFTGLPAFGPQLISFGNRPLFAYGDDQYGWEPFIARSVAPVAVADTANVVSGTGTVINVLSNDTDGDSPSGSLTVRIATPPAHGSAVPEAGGVRYTPDGGYTGADTFDYYVVDELGSASAVTRVTLTVSAAATGGNGGNGGEGGGGGGGGGALDLAALALLAMLLASRRRAIIPESGRDH
jgi:ELWxxDGT repeat protein